MSIAASGELVHIPFGERPGYGQPYPEGIAVGHISQTGDATGSPISFTFNANPGNLYRFEGCLIERGNTVGGAGFAITQSRFIAIKSGLGEAAFDFSLPLSYYNASTFQVYTIAAGARGTPSTNPLGPTGIESMIRRLPMGRIDGPPGVAQVIFFMQLALNVDTVTHEASCWFTYWGKEALYSPGFLSSFYESPAVPQIIR